MSFNAIHENKILAKISRFTVWKYVNLVPLACENGDFGTYHICVVLLTLFTQLSSWSRDLNLNQLSSSVSVNWF